MLAGTSRKPGDVLGIIHPRMGVITVELAAVHAVTAGAKPEYLPVIVAAVEALLDPKHDWRSATTTTNPCAPLNVQMGAKKGTSTVTVFEVRSFINYIFENARISMADFNIRNNNRKPLCRENEANPTVVSSPNCYLVMVAGGEGKHSVFLETTRYDPVTIEIKK